MTPIFEFIMCQCGFCNDIGDVKHWFWIDAVCAASEFVRLPESELLTMNTVLWSYQN